MGETVVQRAKHDTWRQQSTQAPALAALQASQAREGESVRVCGQMVADRPLHALALALCVTALNRPASAYNNGVGRLPPMGWNSWCTAGAGGAPPSVCNLVGADPCSSRQVALHSNAAAL